MNNLLKIYYIFGYIRPIAAVLSSLGLKIIQFRGYFVVLGCLITLEIIKNTIQNWNIQFLKLTENETKILIIILLSLFIVSLVLCFNVAVEMLKFIVVILLSFCTYLIRFNQPNGL